MPAFAPFIAPVAGGLISLLRGNQQQGAEEEARRQFNANAAARDAAANRVIGGAQASGFNPFGVNTLNSGQSGVTSNFMNSNTRGSSQDRVHIDPANRPLINQQRTILERLLGGLGEGNQGETIRGVRARQAAFDGARANQANTIGRRNLGRISAGGGIGALNAAEAASSADFLSQADARERAKTAQALGLSTQFQDLLKGANRTFQESTNQVGGGTQTGSFSREIAPNVAGLIQALSPAPQVSTNTGLTPGLDAGEDALNAFFAQNPDFFSNKGSISGGVPPGVIPTRMTGTGF